MSTTSQLIVVDIGNSFIKFGLFDARTREQGLPKPLSFCVETTSSFSDLSTWLERFDSRLKRFDWIISSVNSARTASLKNWLGRSRLLDSVQELALADLPLTVLYDRPNELGIDRAIAALGAKTFFGMTGPILVVDIGTAATIDLIDSAGIFAGGAILPGPRIAAQSLYEKTAKLPRTQPSPLENVYPATNTLAAINLGIGYGLAGAIFAFYVQTRHQMNSMGNLSDFPILMTGRGGNQIEKQLESILEAVREVFGHGTVPSPRVESCSDLVLRTLAFISQNKRE